MDVNDIFTQIGNFWNRISVPILFHVILFILYRFIFGAISIKTRLENYIKSERFSRTKAILTEFELWKIFPLILIVIALIYLTLFNSATDIVSSIKIFPFKISYSKDVFLQEYEPKDNIIDIAKYGNDTIPSLFKVDQLKEKFLEEYKSKYPDSYSSWVKWANEQFIKRIRYFNLTALTIIILFLLLLKALADKQRKKRFILFLKFSLIFLFSLPTLFILRYRAEQSIEEQFANEIIFVKTSLEADVLRKPILSATEIIALEKNLELELTKSNSYTASIWISRLVGGNKVLEYFLGRRRLRNISVRNDNLYN